jgi:hypothetical protein
MRDRGREWDWEIREMRSESEIGREDPVDSWERETERRRREIGKIGPDLPVGELGDAGETRERRWCDFRWTRGLKPINPGAWTRDPRAKPDGSGRTRATRIFRRFDPPCPAIPVAVSGEPLPVCSNPAEPRSPVTQNPTRWPVRPERKTRFFLCVFRRNRWLFRWIFGLNPQGIKTLWSSLGILIYDYFGIRVLWFWGFSIDWWFSVFGWW